MSETIVTPFFHSESSTWSYLVHAAGSQRAAIIDPVLDFDAASGSTGSASAEAILAAVKAQDLQVDWILETHAHADHLSGAAWLKARLPGARVAIGEGIRKVQKTFVPIYNLGEHFPVDGSQFDALLADGAVFAVGPLNVRVMATPGHTNDSVSYLIGDAVFVGDTLFMPDGGTARCDFPGGDAGRLFRSIHQLFALPENTRVFVCHDYAPGGRAVACETTIAAQREANIHVGHGRSEQEFVAMREARDATLGMPMLILPAIQINIRAGQMPPAEANGVAYLKLPLNQFA